MTEKQMLCKRCGKHKREYRGKFEYFSRCAACRRPSRTMNAKDRRRLKLVLSAGTCPACGFVPVHFSQLQVDHIDGNPKNDEQANLQVLCANCHALKTWKQLHETNAAIADIVRRHNLVAKILPGPKRRVRRNARA